LDGVIFVSIILGFNKEDGLYEKENLDKWYIPATLTGIELEAVKIITGALTDVISEEVTFERRADGFLALVVLGHHDFCRIRVNDLPRCFSLFLSPRDKIMFGREEILKRVESKNQIYWKFGLGDIRELKAYAEMIVAAYLSSIWAHDVFCNP